MAMQRQQKTFSSYVDSGVSFDDILEFQKKSYDDFLHKGLERLFKDIFPIVDNNKRFSIEFISYKIGESKITPREARKKQLDYTAPLKIYLKLINKVTNTEKEEEIVFADIPVMTPQKSFIVNGKEKIVVSQIVRASGVRFFLDQNTKGRRVFGAEVRPVKKYGAWVAFESDSNGKIYVRIDKSTRKVPLTTFIRAFGPKTKEDVKRLFRGDEKAYEAIEKTFEIDEANILDDVYVSMYKIIRSGEPSSPEKAKELIESKFNPDRFDMSEIGRINLNKRSGREVKEKDLKVRHLTLEDIVFIVKEMLRMSGDPKAEEDDIDDLSNRRVRLIGELVSDEARGGLFRMVRNTKDRMITTDSSLLQLPTDIINLRIFKTTIQNFFKLDQLCQPLKQKNVLDELEHFRTISSIGVGGVMKEHTSIGVRDIHPTHYGRICPIHSPEGPNIGLVLHLTLFTKINKHGLLETPYFKVENGKVTNKVDYLSADEERKYKVTSAEVKRDEEGNILDEMVPARENYKFTNVNKNQVDYIDVSTSQIISIATCLIPFINHNIAARSLFGSTMQRQAVPCFRPEAPIIATGYESKLAKISGRLIVSSVNGEVAEVDSEHITIKHAGGNERHNLTKYELTNAPNFSTHQRPIVSVGDKVKKGDVLADVSSTSGGQLALGKNLRVAFLSYDGLNYEDSIVISKKLIERDTYTSVYVKKHVVDIRDTKLGPEIMTADIPNVSEYRLRNLDPYGVVRVGAEVEEGDILVGKSTPRVESQLTPEEKLLQSIFGDKLKDMKDTSLRLPAGGKGRVIDIQIFDKSQGYELDPGVIKRVNITIAQIRPIQEGDKLANRHGNKGVISKVLPIEDMPYTEDGKPVDILLTPLGVPSRQNLGQILEAHLGLAAEALGYQAIVPPLTSVTTEELENELEEAGFPRSGRLKLFSGKTGEKFEGSVTVGTMYIMKLDHMVEDKFQVRSTGPYSIISQQPLGGRVRDGGLRLGEMEVWALLGHGAAHILREMLTIKSDDILGRSAAYNSMIKSNPIKQFGTPASFNVLLHYFRGLALDVDLKIEDKEFKEKRI